MYNLQAESRDMKVAWEYYECVNGSGQGVSKEGKNGTHGEYGQCTS